MKISDAILLLLHTEGGEIIFNKFDWYIGEMMKVGLIEFDTQSFNLKLTEKGKERLIKNGIIQEEKK